MPGVISVSDFLRETREDLSSPTTSNFVTHIPQCRETVSKLEEVRENLRFFCTDSVSSLAFKAKYDKCFSYEKVFTDLISMSLACTNEIN